MSKVKVDFKKCSFSKKAEDTGCPESQICILTSKIGYLTEHINKNKHDNVSKRSLIKHVCSRRKLLNYLKKKSTERYIKAKQGI